MPTYNTMYLWVQKKGSECMSPRMGRPTDDHKNITIKTRISENDVSMIDFCCSETGMKKSEVIRLGIKKVYEELQKNKIS